MSNTDYITGQKCPLCGSPFAFGKGWERKGYTQIGLGMAQAITAGAEYERRRPARSASLESDVIVPGLQAMITGLLAGIAGSGATAIATDQLSPWIVGLCVGSCAWSLTWTMLLRENRALLWEVESITSADLDGDGVIGAPMTQPDQPIAAQQQPTIHVEVTERDKYHIRSKFIDLPAEHVQLSELARGVLAGQPFSESSWTGKDMPFSRKNFRLLRDELLKRGLAEWANINEPRQGIKLTAAGRAVFRKLSEQPHSPTDSDCAEG